jgi:hypothetical protein
MAEETYDGAIGIDLGMFAHFGGEANIFILHFLLTFDRYHLLLRRHLRGNQCRNQYVQSRKRIYTS